MLEHAENLLKTIQTLNQQRNMPWTAALNVIAQDPLDKLIHHFGYQPGPNEPSLAEREQMRPSGTFALDSFAVMETRATATDWRNVNGQNFVTSIKNQNFCSSCVAFAVAAAIESQARITTNIPVNGPNAAELPDLSEGQLYFCSQNDDPHNCFTGWGITSALDFAKNPGIVPDTAFPYPIHSIFDMNYSGCNLPPNWQAQTTTITDYKTLNTPDEIKNWLATKGPVVTGFTVSLDFLFYRSGVYIRHDEPWNRQFGGHCIACVGYDDDRQAWLCKNSWTNLWGDGGFVWFGYNQCGIDAPMWGIEGFTTIYRTGS